MGTKIESLPKINVKEYMGFVPTSVWNLSRHSEWEKEIADFGDISSSRKETCKFLPGLKYSSFNSNVAAAVIKYWNREKYESVLGQLSDIRNYEEFLDRIQECLFNCYRILKDNKFCIWVVGDFRRNRNVCCFHGHVINRALKVGFKLYDIIIEQLNTPFAWCRVRENYRLNFVAKAHQYILVFRKW